MKNRTLSLCARFFSATLLFWVVALPLAAHAHPSEAFRSDQWANTQFANADTLRDALEKQPEKQRTRHEYQRVIDAYRRVYFGAPTSAKADPSVTAVADVMLEMGRQFHDEKILRSAITQYEFLRKEYPGSRSRFTALLTIGQIYKNDLNDPDSADDTFHEFLRRYPHNELAAAAKMALAEPPPVAKKNDRQTEEKPRVAAENTSPATSPAAAKSIDAHSVVVQEDASAGPQTTTITRIHYQTKPDSATVFIDLSGEVKYDVQRISNPDRIYFDLFDTKLSKGLNGRSLAVNNDLLKQVRAAKFQPGKTRVVLDVAPDTSFQVSTANNPARLKIELVAKNTATAAENHPESAAKKSSADSSEDTTPLKSAALTSSSPVASENIANPAPIKRIVEADADDDAESKPAEAIHSRQKINPAKSAGRGKHLLAKSSDPVVHEALPTTDGDRSLIRALGLKIGKIVIDPGHGGHDTGTIGPHGLLEKDLVLDVSKRLDKLLETRLSAEVVMTRDDDTFIPLEQRTAIANEEHADLFISVHANSSHDPDARGVETYYLNFTSSADALEVAARENAMSDDSIYQLQDLVKTIALKEKIEESHEFAFDVQQALHRGLASRSPGLRDRGVKKAPFVVLIGAHMPSILAEISFVSNPGDERRLRTPAYRQRIAESLYQGVAKYVSGLSGVKVASKVDKSEGQ